MDVERIFEVYICMYVCMYVDSTSNGSLKVFFVVVLETSLGCRLMN
jgi:hypothetical protein